MTKKKKKPDILSTYFKIKQALGEKRIKQDNLYLNFIIKQKTKQNQIKLHTTQVFFNVNILIDLNLKSQFTSSIIIP